MSPVSQPPPSKPPVLWMPSRRHMVKIIAWYAGLSAGWLLTFNWLVKHFVHVPALANRLEFINGWLVIAVTAAAVGLALNKYVREVRRSAAQIVENEARLRVVGDNLPDSYIFQYVHNAGGRDGPKFNYISAGVERVHGVPAALVMQDAQNLFSQIDPADLLIYNARVAECVREPKDFRVELRTRRPSGGCRNVLVQSRPRRLEDGTLVWDGFVTDVTERKRAEAVLAESEHFAINTLDSLSAHIAILDETGAILAVNAAWRRFGEQNAARPETVAAGINYLAVCDAAQGAEAASAHAFAAGIRGVLGGRQPEFYLEYPCPDGEKPRWFLGRVTRFIGAGPLRLVVEHQNITTLKHAEKALRESERLLVEMERTAKIGGWDYDVASGRCHWTTEVARIHELDSPEPPSKAAGLLYYPGESATRLETAFTAAIQHGTPYDLELEFVSARDVHKWVRTICRTVIKDGKVAKLFGSFQDITERREAEAALRESETQFRAIFETASIGVYQAHPVTGRFLRVNRRHSQITGNTPQHLLLMRVQDIIHPEDWPRHYELQQQLLRGDIAEYHLEKRYVRKDGGITWANAHATAIRDAAGQAVCVVATVEDITERRQAEEERTLLVAALEQAAESIVITGLSGTILYVNPAFEKISGYSREEAVGATPRFLKSGQHAPAFYQQLWDTLRRGQVWRGRLINRRKNGTLYQEEATLSPVRNTLGQVEHYMAVKLDVTREVALENQFRQSQKLEAIGQLAGGVAHDFNNILTSILMQVEVSGSEKNLPPEIYEGLRQIRGDAERATSLTRQLLLFSRRQLMQPRVLDLNEIVTNLAKMLQRIIGEDVRLQLNLQPVPLLTQADPGMLDQVALNLSVNARDAMPSGGQLTIETSEKIVDEAGAALFPEAAPGRYVCLSVTDTGTGIAPEVLPHIFEPFFTTKDTGKGTGLGLATVFGIVKQHGGWLSVNTESGRGTTFHICLPAFIQATAAPPAGAAPAPTAGGSETILLVEDEPAVRKSTRTILARNGYQVLAAANGKEALQLWVAHRAEISLLLTDLVMPGGITGQQLARRLLEDEPALRIIYTTGYSAELAGHELSLQEGQNFLPKPFHSEDLLKLVRESLDR